MEETTSLLLLKTKWWEEAKRWLPGLHTSHQCNATAGEHMHALALHAL